MFGWATSVRIEPIHFDSSHDLNDSVTYFLKFEPSKIMQEGESVTLKEKNLREIFTT